MSSPPPGQDPTQQAQGTPPAEQPGGQPFQQPGGYLPYPDNGQAQQQYGQPEQAAPGAESSGTRTLWILAYVLSAVALLLPIAGIAAIACGAVAWRRGSPRGKIATFVAIAVTVIAWVGGILFVLS